MHFNQPIISVQELKENINNPSFILLDCTINKVGQKIDSENLELIPNSKFFDLEGRFSDHIINLPHTLINENDFTKEVQNLGINKDSILICYDRWGVYSSPRVWWMFKVMGFNDVYVLNGGLPSWKQENYLITNNYILENKKGNFTADFQFDWYVNKQIMLNSIDDFSKTIIDARSEGRFRGIDPEPRKGLRSGNIPNSKNLFFETVLDGEKLKTKEELEIIFNSITNNEKENIFSCGSGVTASILALAANFIGYDKIKVYDGSWSEWGADENLPISK